jgi:hypothetical protein
MLWLTFRNSAVEYRNFRGVNHFGRSYGAARYSVVATII